INVLVLLRGILGVLERTVGAPVEPLRMLAHPGMVRRALNGQIDCDLDAERPCGLEEAPEILERAELGMDRRMPALRPPDGPRASRIRGPCRPCIVRTLAVGPAEGVYGRQVYDVEAHALDVGKPAD